MSEKIEKLLQPKGHLAPMRLMKTAPGTCPECGAKHKPEEPHDRDSLAYQYSFYNKYGRVPSWQDAMAHCPDHIKQICIGVLTRFGIVVVSKEPEKAGENECLEHIQNPFPSSNLP